MRGRVILLAALQLWGQSESIPRHSLNLDGIDAELKSSIQSDLDSGDYELAERAVLARLEGEHAPKRLLEVIGALYFLDKKYMDSAIAYSKAKQYGQLPERDRFTLAMDYVELKKTNWARRQLSELVNTQPKEPLYRYWLGRLDYDQQQFARACTQFHEVIQLDPDYVRAYDSLGLCSEALGDLSIAEGYYRHANELNDRQALRLGWPAIDYGAFLRKQGRYAEAKQYLDKAITIDPSAKKAFYERGRVAEALKDLPSAISDLKRAASLDSEDSSAVYCLYRLYRESGQNKLADAMLHRFRELSAKEHPSR